jgi:hypothetical protein
LFFRFYPPSWIPMIGFFFSKNPPYWNFLRFFIISTFISPLFKIYRQRKIFQKFLFWVKKYFFKNSHCWNLKRENRFWRHLGLSIHLNFFQLGNIFLLPSFSTQCNLKLFIKPLKTQIKFIMNSWSQQFNFTCSPRW